MESKFVDNDVFSKIKKYQLGPNDVFISAAGTVGKVGIPPVVPLGKTISLTENAHKIRTIDTGKINNKYIMYMLDSEQAQTSLSSFITKTGTPKLSIDSLRKLEIPFISIDAQKNLVKQWEAISARIKKLYLQIK